MSRLKCKKCGAVFEYEYRALDSVVHIGPYKRVNCPACGKGGWFNVYSSVKDTVTYPPQRKQAEEQPEQLSEEEKERRQIEESKYEKT